MGNKSKRTTLAARALGAEVKVMSLQRDLEKTQSDMAIIAKAFIGYVAETEKTDETVALAKVNELIEKTVEGLNNGRSVDKVD